MSEANLDKENSIPFYPDHVRTEFRVTVGVLLVVAIIGIVGLLVPLGLGEQADPMNTPAHVKPEWYFLGLYQLLKYIPKTAGAVGPVIAVLIVMLWPFIDRKADRSPRAQRVRLVLTILGIIVFIAMTIWGEVS